MKVKFRESEQTEDLRSGDQIKVTYLDHIEYYLIITATSSGSNPDLNKYGLVILGFTGSTGNINTTWFESGNLTIGENTTAKTGDLTDSIDDLIKALKSNGAYSVHKVSLTLMED